jgi:hypothetical protein
MTLLANIEKTREPADDTRIVQPMQADLIGGLVVSDRDKIRAAEREKTEARYAASLASLRVMS